MTNQTLSLREAKEELSIESRQGSGQMRNKRPGFVQSELMSQQPKPGRRPVSGVHEPRQHAVTAWVGYRESERER